MNKPLILVTNDDGIDSKGIRLLVSIMSGFGEVVILCLFFWGLESLLSFLTELVLG